MLASSFFLIFLHSISFETQEISIGEFHLAMSKSSLEWMVRVATTYFLVVFSFRAVGEITVNFKKRTEVILSDFERDKLGLMNNSERARILGSIRSDPSHDQQQDARFSAVKEYTLSKWDNRILNLELFGLLVIEIAFAYIVALSSLFFGQKIAGLIAAL